MLYFYHLLFTKCHVFLILHETANVPGSCPEKLTIYDQKEVDFSAFKPSWMLHHRITSRNVNRPFQSTVGQTSPRQHWGLICYCKARISFHSIISAQRSWCLHHSLVHIYNVRCWSVLFTEIWIKNLKSAYDIKLYCRARHLISFALLRSNSQAYTGYLV